MKNTSLKKKLLPLVLMGATSINSFVGCGNQSSMVKYMNNLENCNWYDTESGKFESNVSAYTPRTYKSGFDSMTSSLKKLGYSLLEQVDKTGAFVGAQPFRGRFFGKTTGKTKDGIFQDTDSYKPNYKPKAKKTPKNTKDALTYTLLAHLPISSTNFIAGLGEVNGHAMDFAIQTLNEIVLMPTYLNTTERDKIVDDSPKGCKNPNNDNFKYLADSAIDTFGRGFLRLGLYSMGHSNLVPNTVKYAWQNGFKKLAGMSDNKIELEENRSRFRNTNGEIDSERVTANIIPGSLADWFWRTRQSNKDDEYPTNPLEKRESLNPDTINEFLKLKSDFNYSSKWKNCNAKNQTPGKVEHYNNGESVNPNEILMHPSKSLLCVIGETASGLLDAFSMFTGKSGGNDSGSSGGFGSGITKPKKSTPSITGGRTRGSSGQ